MTERYVAVIQAGGKGTRVRELTQDKIPKPLMEINGKTMLEWQIENLIKNEIREIIIITGYLGDRIETYIGDGSKWEIKISYIRETEPLGSAGALYYLKGRCSKDILLIFGDVMFDIDWERFIGFHEKMGGLATLLVHPNSHAQDSDLVVLDDDSKVLSFDYKNRIRDYFYENCVNAGIYILSAEVLERFSKVKKTDLEKDILLPLIEEGKIYGYRTPEYVKDAGTPERFQRVSREQREGIWNRKNLKNRQACVFLDRDGTVNRYQGLLYAEEQFELETGVAEAVRRLNEAGYLVILVTNQPVVARGLCGIEDVKRIHRKMQVLLGEEGAYLDDIMFCPHHPDKGFSGENVLYKVSCNCRKPAIGMIAHAAEKYNIDLSQSFIIGDSTVDIQTGKNAGMRTILLLTGQAGRDKKYDAAPDFTAENLMEAVTVVLKNESEILEVTE
ncbi:MAG: HAD-IIIA family hydrolase [Lachnospiraceae bacterium]|nr:HAD-IIIA family hydrolase [Lachnospiraceae bacterium]